MPIVENAMYKKSSNSSRTEGGGVKVKSRHLLMFLIQVLENFAQQLHISGTSSISLQSQSIQKEFVSHCDKRIEIIMS